MTARAGRNGTIVVSSVGGQDGTSFYVAVP